MTPTAHSHETVKDYYGRVLKSNLDLRTEACCSQDALAPHIREVLDLIEPEVIERFYGCGSPIPPGIVGRTVLDLGCGTGRDAFIVSRLVGPAGRVIGVDMTAEQLDVARRNMAAQMERFGYAEANVDFREGYIEDLGALGIADESVDVVISNCVINLAPDKRAVFSEILRVLKPGGELYFADVFADRRLDADVASDPVMIGECLGGAMYIEDFRRLLASLGVLDYRVMSSRVINLIDPALKARAGLTRFKSKTIRAFKLAGLEDICEDYGQVATYRGTLPECPHAFTLDDHHLFQTGKPMLVCGNTAAMVQDTRFGTHFDVIGDRSVNYGPFDCSADASEEGASSPCC